MAQQKTSTAFSDAEIYYSHGEKIDETEVPYQKFRRLFDYGVYREERIDKRAEDTLDYVLDLRKWLDPDEKISAVRAHALPDDLIISNLQYSDTCVVLWLAGGDDLVRHAVNLRVYTDRGVTKVFRFLVKTVGTAPELIFIQIEYNDVLIGTYNDNNNIELSVSENPIDFGDVGIVDFPKTKTLQITNVSGETVYPRELRTTGGFSFTSVPKMELENGESFVIYITYNALHPHKLFGELLINTGNGEYKLASIIGNALP